MTKVTLAPTFIFAWASKNFSLPTRKKMPGQGERPPPAAGMTFATVPCHCHRFGTLRPARRAEGVPLLRCHCAPAPPAGEAVGGSRPDVSQRGRRRTMTEFIIQRMARFREAVHGRLYIHGEYVCDTLERAAQCLPAGSYSLLQYRRDWHPQKVGVGQLIRFVASDGCYALQCGEIAIGEWKYLGFLIHSRDIFDTLQERVRRLTSRHQVITVIIREDGDGDFFVLLTDFLTINLGSLSFFS